MGIAADATLDEEEVEEAGHSSQMLQENHLDKEEISGSEAESQTEDSMPHHLSHRQRDLK